MSEIAIRVKGLGKRYTIAAVGERHDTLRDALAAPLHRLRRRLNGRQRSEPVGDSIDVPRSGHDAFWALKDVTFDIPKGEVVGIIGRNGAGKSTLLKILSRITEPTEGWVGVDGRVASLLEVGTGFHPELTGRENVYLNGAILGMRRAEIDARFDEIVAFAEVEPFLETPVKRYSSGMHVRLAFAVAAHLHPEILLVDEVLAVGDAAFQKKCLGRMGTVAEEGRTVLFVSHNLGAVARLCPRTILLDGGTLQAVGESRQIIERYLATTQEQTASRAFAARPNSRGQIQRVRLLDPQGLESTDFPTGVEPVVEIDFSLHERVRGCHIACIVTTLDGYHVFSTADTDSNPALFDERPPGAHTVQVQLPTRLLNTGTYHVAVGLGIPGIESFDRQDAVSFTIHDAGDFGTLKEGARRAGLLLVDVPWTYQR